MDRRRVEAVARKQWTGMQSAVLGSQLPPGARLADVNVIVQQSSCYRLAPPYQSSTDSERPNRHPEEVAHIVSRVAASLRNSLENSFKASIRSDRAEHRTYVGLAQFR